MRIIIRHVPGFIAALAAFILVRLLVYLGLDSTVGEILTFLVIYSAVAVAADRAMLAYSRERGSPPADGI